MAYMTANVGASHMRAGYKEPTGLPNASAVDLMEELIESQNSIVIRDSMILCAFAKGATPDEVMLDMECDQGDDALGRLDAKGEFAMDLARKWNSNIGIELVLNQWMQTFSWRLRKEPIPAGVASGMVSFVDDDDEKAYGEILRIKRMETGWNSINGVFHASYCKQGIAVGLVGASPWILVQGWILSVHKTSPFLPWQLVQASANCAHLGGNANYRMDESTIKVVQ